MITTSANYKTAIKAVSREIRAYLKFNGSTIYRGVDGLVSINWNAQLFDKERFCVNCANAAYIEAEMYGEPIQNLESAYVEAFIGVVLEYKSSKPSGSIEDDTADVEYVKLGRFDVTEVVRKNGKVMISAYDRMAKLSENYVTTVTPTDDGYSKSAIVTDIKNQCGLTWSQSFSGYVPEIVNSTMRDQLCWLYGSTTSTGQSLMLSRDGTTVISKVIVGQTALNYTIDESTTYLDGLNDQPSFTITSYTANAGENTYSYGSGAGVECYNPYITSTIASNTYNFIKNFSYTPMTLEFRGDPAIELGDILTVTNGNNSYSVVVMKMATVFNGGLKTTIYCYGNTEEWDAISNSPTGARIIQTENMVRIEAARASEAEGELAASITTTAEGILSTVSQTYQTQANAAAVNLLPSVYYRENVSGKTWVDNGVTWTVNNDGSVTATGTATGSYSDYYLSSSTATDSVPWIIVDPAKKHILSGGINSNAYIATGYIANPGDTWAWSTSSSSATGTAAIPLGAKYLRVFLRITQGYAIPTGGVTFYPMLEVGDTAHPYVSTHNGTGALENRMVSAESAIIQNAQGISLEAQTRAADVGNVQSNLEAEIEIRSNQIQSLVENVETLDGSITQKVATAVTQSTSGLDARITSVKQTADDTAEVIDTHFEFSTAGMKIKGTEGSSDTSFLQLASDRVSLYENDTERLWLDEDGANAQTFNATQAVRIGSFIWEEYSGGIRLIKN